MTDARLRKRAVAEIERLIAYLDTTEPDADFEPSLGAIEAGSGLPTPWTRETLDREDGDDNGVANQDAFDAFKEREAALGRNADEDQTELGQGHVETDPDDSGIFDAATLASVETDRARWLRADALWEERRAAIAAAEAALKSMLANRRTTPSARCFRQASSSPKMRLQRRVQHR